jgi:hypothetical protein
MYSKSQIWINFKELQAEKCTGKKPSLQGRLREYFII